jgi:hypothetical protein
MPEPRIKPALDQNFPVLILNAAALLPEVEVAPIHKIDPRLSDLDDRKLLIALYQRGWRGLIANNYKMLWVPTEIAAVVKTKVVVFAVEGVGDDPLRATGAVLLELPSVVKRIVPDKAQISGCIHAAFSRRMRGPTSAQRPRNAGRRLRRRCTTRSGSPTAS